MLISDKIKESKSSKGADFSLEFFPPRTDIGAHNIQDRILRLSSLNPLFVSVTWGAGGSTSEKSLQLAEYCQSLGLTTLLHLTCTNMDRSVLDHALRRAKDLGIRNILALRGDAPRGQEYAVESSDEFKQASDLVKYIRSRHGKYFCIGVAAYPEGHRDISSLSPQSVLKDLPYLIEKVESGADFIMLQMCFSADTIINFINGLRQAHPCFKDIPIIPGLLPINTFQSFARATQLAHCAVPPNIYSRLSEVANDDSKVKEVGVEILSDLCNELYTKSYAEIRLFHFYTLNLEKSVALVLDRSNIFKLPPHMSSVDVTPPFQENLGNSSRRRRRSSLSTHNKVLVEEARRTKSAKFTSDIVVESIDPNGHEQLALAISTGEGELGRQATWDDFPNGRFGDPRSPAFTLSGYGADPYSTGLAISRIPTSRALDLWGAPETVDDISKLICNHLTSGTPNSFLPWSDSLQDLSDETTTIAQELLLLNESGYWTISSQPALNGVRSSDPIYGWGPDNGYVYQKAFVEFFISTEKWHRLKERLDSMPEGEVSYYACGSNPSTYVSTGNETNAVTWGIFPHREVLQPTVIEPLSFQTWSEEVFRAWKTWQSLFASHTKSFKLIQDIYDTYYLVALVHHDYIGNPSRLWEYLLQ
ncbi:hypothetical protein CANCADRAFT_30430 [Tortispora caseinolytica NRRL Y-17796]|uniref:MTHFR SAM-binding regulatory domain-containing protein n=1 Tax=Tortispora caseinolytica NRRL Y-17796 TaxID=767744 RepID=A0A1E4TKA7_9ASCO|nr:hypothetical protein CANCADRAFT_30430 [Tortispora caseinolytica NRRL Y-17796]